jgi:hypothetical protein
MPGGTVIHAGWDPSPVPPGVPNRALGTKRPLHHNPGVKEVLFLALFRGSLGCDLARSEAAAQGFASLRAKA